MNRLFVYVFITILIFLAAGCGDPTKGIFTGQDLTGWSAYPPDKTAQWSVNDGIIFCQASGNTYLRSEKEYANYHLHCEWRWPNYPGNCSIGLHTTGPDTDRPNSIEVHLKSPDAGDLYLAGADLSVSKMGLQIRTIYHPIVRIPKELNDTENLLGQWNSLDVFCQGSSIRVFVNGFPQNEVKDVNRSSGSICLVSRATPIEFQNLYLNPLK